MDDLKSRAIELVDVITKAGEKLIEETKDFAEVSKIKYDIRMSQNELNAIKLALADRFLEIYADSTEDEKMKELIRSIEIKAEEIKQLRLKAEAVKGRGYEANSESAVITIRSEETEDSENQTQEIGETVKCPDCNADVPVEFLYCNKCGHKFD